MKPLTSAAAARCKSGRLSSARASMQSAQSAQSDLYMRLGLLLDSAVPSAPGGAGAGGGVTTAMVHYPARSFLAEDLDPGPFRWTAVEGTYNAERL